MIQSLVYFFIWPFLFFIIGLKRYYYKDYKLLALLFFIFGALTLTPTVDADISSYENFLYKYEDTDFSYILTNILKSLVGVGDRGFEIYLDIVNYLSNIFGGSMQLSFVFSALTFYIFWINILKILRKEHYLLNKDNTVALLLLIAFSIYIIYFRAINGRFYLAYWLFIWGAYKVINENNVKFILISLASIYIHQTFLFGVMILGLFYIVRNKKSLSLEIFLYILIVVANVINEFGISFIADNLNRISSTYTETYSSYADTRIIEIRGSRVRSWFLELRLPILFYSAFFAILLARLNKNIVFNKETWRFYYFFLYFWLVNSFTYEVFQLGTRFRNVLIGFMIILLFKIYNNNYHRKPPAELIVFFLAFILYKIVSLRILGDMISIYIFAPFGWLMSLILENITIW